MVAAGSQVGGEGIVQQVAHRAEQGTPRHDRRLGGRRRHRHGCPIPAGAIDAPSAHTRGDLMTGPVMTIDAHTPMPDVIGLTLTHFAGEQPRGPEFEPAGSCAFRPTCC
ncbi:hypothetical protein EJ357_17860 [Streptomyces cyaneochromogenes]|uniref:Uncharacterized protein n=1 Tax=Streptomyces cyaneochromogenes TaxID=2496836 RepID=A0A3S9M7K9_9ACTN|nr:hypothetical protein EJ357_17860 [Streptomyces cyaneochromogenes]